MRFLIGLLSLSWLGACVTTSRCPLKQALSVAGENRAELERVLEHYRAEGDPQKLQAARFLIENMEGHGYVVTVLKDKDDNELDFEATDYPNFKQALAALDALEEKHGEVDFKRQSFVEDMEIVTADYLIENIDLAFQAWREKPWARNLSFEAFCEYVLPYRGSNEPADSWREACLERYKDLPQQVDDPSDPRKAAQKIGPDVHKWVRFSDLYYLHPTDQGFEEMNRTRTGRCEDITNMMTYAMRANAIASAADYTPFWADRDNNHAWEVTLDENGQGKAGLSNRAAKVYRKTYSIQRDSLGAIKSEEEDVPRWLSRRNYIDVTSQYLETSDVEIQLTNAVPEDARFAYICVFNGGDWNAIHWGRIEQGHVTFTDMGPNIAYLPAYYVEKELIPAAPPFILTEDGAIRPLVATGDTTDIEIVVTKPDTPDADTRVDKPKIVVKPGKTYELSVWDDGWTSLGKKVAGDRPVSFEAVPNGLLFWLVAEKSRKLERIFTIEDGKQIFW